MPGIEAIPGDNAALDALKHASFRRNALCGAAWDGLWSLGTPFCMVWTVVPVYLLLLGASKTLVQTVMVCFSLAAFLQLFSARVINGPRRRLLIAIDWMLFTACLLGYGTVAALFWNHLSKALLMCLFLLACLGMIITMHFGGPPYVELCVSNVPVRKRGRFTAMRNLTYGCAGLLGIISPNRFINMWPEPHNFHYSMIVGSTIMMLSCFVIFGWHDHATGASSTPVPGISPLVAGHRLYKNINFRVFLLFYMFLLAAQTLAPLLIGYGRDVLKLEPSRITYFTGAFFVGPILGGLLLAPLADRFGFRIVAILCGVLLAVGFLLPILFWNSLVPVLITYTCYAACNAISTMLVGSLGAEMVHDVSPAMILAVGNTMAIPLGLAVAPLAGRLVDQFGAEGYLAIFVMGVMASGMAALGFALLLREPRTGQELHVHVREITYR